MKLLNLKVLLTFVAALVPVANATFGWHLVPTVVVAVIAAFIGLVLAIAHVEASHGSLAQDWAEIEPRLRALVSSLDSTTNRANAATAHLSTAVNVAHQAPTTVSTTAPTTADPAPATDPATKA